MNMSSREMEIAVLKDAVKILKRVARRDKYQETQEAVNVIEVVIGELEIIAWFETGLPHIDPQPRRNVRKEAKQ